MFLIDYKRVICCSGQFVYAGCPVYMKGLGKILPKGNPVSVPFDSYMRIGTPVFPKGKTAEEIVNDVEQQIYKLKAEFD